MKHLQLYGLALMLLFSTNSLAATAKDSGGKFGKVIAWIGVGGGSTTLKSPKHQIDFDGTLLVTAGIDAKLFGPFGITLGALGGGSYGKMNYNYTDSYNVNYQASDMKVATGLAGLQAGLQIIFLDSSILRLFVTGGVFAEGLTIRYTPTTQQIASFSSTKYQTSQSDNLLLSGTYAEVGLDLIAINGYGLRFIGRMAKGHSGKIEALANQKMETEEVEGAVAIARKF